MNILKVTILVLQAVVLLAIVAILLYIGMTLPTLMRP